jgi:hypothetical protein
VHRGRSVRQRNIKLPSDLSSTRWQKKRAATATANTQKHRVPAVDGATSQGQWRWCLAPLGIVVGPSSAAQPQTGRSQGLGVNTESPTRCGLAVYVRCSLSDLAVFSSEWRRT